ncbi:hypothetical protein D3C81_2164920 [compost metagenome]
MALQVFIFSCWVAFRHLLMKALRSSPLRVCSVASALQVFIFSCWAVAANPCALINTPNSSNGTCSIFMA